MHLKPANNHNGEISLRMTSWKTGDIRLIKADPMITG
jgi:hypothetical protein